MRALLGYHSHRVRIDTQDAGPEAYGGARSFTVCVPLLCTMHQSSSTKAASLAPIAARRSALLSRLGALTNTLMVRGVELGATDALRCDEPAVRDVCVVVEAALLLHLLPPLFTLGPPTVNLVLWHVQQAARQRHAAVPDGNIPLLTAAEAVALARGLCEKHLSIAAPHAPSDVRDAYAARMWICLGLQRRVLHEWVGAIGEFLGKAYAEGALMTTADELGMVVDLLTPLSHLPFAIPDGAPGRGMHLAAFLGFAARRPTHPIPSAVTEATRHPVGAHTAVASTSRTERSQAAASLFSFDFFLNPPSLASTMLHRVPQGPQGHVVSSAVGVSGHDRFGSEADYGEVDGSDDGDVGDAYADSVGEAAANGDEESEGEGAVEGAYASAHDDAPGDDDDAYVPYEPFEPCDTPCEDPAVALVAMAEVATAYTVAGLSPHRAAEAVAEAAADAADAATAGDVCYRRSSSKVVMVETGAAAAFAAPAAPATTPVESEVIAIVPKRSHRGHRRPAAAAPILAPILAPQEDPHALLVQKLGEAAAAERAAAASAAAPWEMEPLGGLGLGGLLPMGSLADGALVADGEAMSVEYLVGGRPLMALKDEKAAVTAPSISAEEAVVTAPSIKTPEEQREVPSEPLAEPALVPAIPLIAAETQRAQDSVSREYSEDSWEALKEAAAAVACSIAVRAQHPTEALLESPLPADLGGSVEEEFVVAD